MDELVHERPKEHAQYVREHLFATQMTTIWCVMEFMHQSCSKVVVSRDGNTRWIKDVYRIHQQRIIKRLNLDVVARWFRQLRE